MAIGPREEPVVSDPGMLRLAARRSLRAVGTLLGVAAAVFLLMSAAPGDPASLALRARGGRRAASPETVAAFRAEYQLDRPLPVRFGAWLLRAALLDFGRSLQDGRPVRDRVAETLPATLALNLSALALGLLIAVPVGVAAARRRDGPFDRASGLVLDLLYASPPFVTGLALLLLLAVRFPLFPVLGGGDAGVGGFVLPVVTLALGAAAPAARVVRTVLLDALASSSAVAARARGEDLRAEVARALRRSSGPLAALGAALLPLAVAGSVLVERLFSIRGSGALLAEAVFSRDTPTVLALTLLASGVVVAGSLAADLVAAAFDPRLSAGPGVRPAPEREG